MKSKFLFLPILALSFALSFASCANAFAKTSTNTSTNKVPQQTEVLIIGAGLSGLITAYELKKAGIKYHILELTPRIGGRVKTVKYKMQNGEEINADSGMEEYWASNPAINIIKELKLPTRHDVAMSSVVLEGKQYEFTESTQKEYVSKIFNPTELKALNDFKKKIGGLLKQTDLRPIPKEMMSLKDISFANWIIQQHLPKKVSEWIRISVECEVGTEWTGFSALDALDEFEIFLGDGENSYRIVNGNEVFTDALAAAIGANNITTNQRVTKINNGGGNAATINYVDGSTNRNATIKATYVVSTIPLFRLGMEVQLDPPLSEKKLQGISTQTYGSYFKVHVFIPESAARFYTKDGEAFLPYLTDSDIGVIYEGNPDQKTKTKIISLLVTGARAEAFSFMSQDQVREKIKKGFDNLWPGFSKDIQGMEFYRYHPRAVAGWPVGRSRYDELSDAIRKPDNRLYLAGDFTEGTHSASAVESAYRVSSQIKQARAGSKASEKKIGKKRDKK